MFRDARKVVGAVASFALFAGCGGSGSSVTVPHPQSLIVGREQSDPGPQPVIDWNVIALKTALAAPTNPPLESRNVAIVQAAVFDAVVAIEGGYHQYAFATPADPHASPTAAIATAAHDALVALYPAQKSTLDVTYANYLSEVPASDAKQAGIDVGREVAEQMLALRANDGSAAAIVAPYTPLTGIGYWQPTPPAYKPALDPGWGDVTPFILRSGDQFRPGPPPSITGATFEADFNEVKAIGSATSTRMTSQTATSLFWAGTATVTQMYNQAVKQLAVANGFSAAQTAHAFAALNLIAADALIAGWEAKYAYNFFRPVTAIRLANQIGNPALVADPLWLQFASSPATPEYPSTSSVSSSAAVTVLTAIFGASPGTFTLRSPATGVVRQYTDFAQLTIEDADARVWGGIDFRNSTVVGDEMGQNVGEFDLQHALQPEQ